MPPLRRAIFILAGKVIPGATFLYLLIFHIQLAAAELGYAVAHEPELGSIALVVNRVMATSFSGMLAVLYIIRPPAARAEHNPLAVVAAFYGSFVLLGLRPIGVLLAVGPTGPASGLQLTISNLVMAVGVGFSVWALMYLRLNFSIIPESRELTLNGPYRIVRHPVYLGEVVSGVGLALALPSRFSVALLLTFVAAQLIRIHFEERLLAAEHPEYAAYAARTKRLIPWLV
jgi:protein-S-isoprenylcysteine O-methyltransferase Ste14